MEKKNWFDENYAYIMFIAESDGCLGALAYSEVVDSYLEKFPNSNFNSDLNEYLKECESGIV